MVMSRRARGSLPPLQAKKLIRHRPPAALASRCVPFLDAHLPRQRPPIGPRPWRQPSPGLHPEPMAHERRLNECKFCCVVIGEVIGQIPAGKELPRSEKPAMNGVVVSVRLDEILDRESACKIFVPGHGRPEMTKYGFACVLHDLQASVAWQQSGQEREIDIFIL